MTQSSTASERKQLVDRFVKQACAIHTDLEENSNTCLNFDRFTFQLANCQPHITETNNDNDGDEDPTLPLWCKSKHEIHEDEMLCGAFCYLLGWAELHEREVHRLEREQVKFPTLQKKSGSPFSPAKLDKALIKQSPRKNKSFEEYDNYKSGNNYHDDDDDNKKNNTKVNHGNTKDCHNNNTSSFAFADHTNFSKIVREVMHTPQVCRVRRAMEQQALRESKVKVTKVNPAPYNQFMRYNRRSETTITLMDANNLMSESESSSSSEESLEEQEMQYISAGMFRDKHEYHSHNSNHYDNDHHHHHHHKHKRPCTIHENVIPMPMIKSVLLEESLPVIRSCSLCMAHILFYAYWCNLREIALLNTFAELHHTSNSLVLPNNVVDLSSSEAVLRLYHTSQRMIRLTLFLLDSVSESITLSAHDENYTTVSSSTIGSGVNSFNTRNDNDTVTSPMISKVDISGYEVHANSPKCITNDNDKWNATSEINVMPERLLGEFLSSTMTLIFQVLSACSSLKNIVCSHDTYSSCTMSEINQNIRTNLLYAWLACMTQSKGTHDAKLIMQNLSVILLRLNVHEQEGNVKANEKNWKTTGFEELNEHGYSHLTSNTVFNQSNEENNKYYKNNVDNVDDDNNYVNTTITTTDSTLKTTECTCVNLSKLLRSVKPNSNSTVMMEYSELLCATALLTVFCDLCSVREADRSNNNTTWHDEENNRRQFCYDVTLVEFLETDVEPFLVSLAHSSNGTLRLRGNQLMSLYWWIREEMKKFTLWQCHSIAFYQKKNNKNDENNAPAAAAAGKDNMDHENGIHIEPSHANTKLEQECHKRIEEAIEAMVKDNKSAEEFANVTMFSLNHAQMQQPLRHDVIILNQECAKEKCLEEDVANLNESAAVHLDAGVAVHVNVDDDDDDSNNNMKSHSQNRHCVLYSLIPNIIVKLWLTLCVTIFRPPLTDLVQISQSTNGNKEASNNVDNNHLVNSNDGSISNSSSSTTTINNEKSNQKSSYNVMKNTISKTPNKSSSITNTITTMVNNTGTTTQSSRASSKDSTKSTSSKRSSSSKRELELANVVSFSIAAVLSDANGSIRNSSKNKCVKKIENYDIKRRLTLPLINEHQVKNKGKTSNQLGSYRDRSVRNISEGVKKCNSFSARKMSMNELSSKRKNANSMQAVMKATDFALLCDNDGARFWERWSDVFAMEETNSVVALERNVYELLSGHRILQTEMSQIANAINTLLPCSFTDLQQLYFSGLESCLIHDTEIHSHSFTNGHGSNEPSMI